MHHLCNNNNQEKEKGTMSGKLDCVRLWFSEPWKPEIPWFYYFIPDGQSLGPVRNSSDLLNH